ncbi:MAG: leucine-rich repeat domain-containing protein [Prevotella sp.]|nr:leucine-rich repeat domain-containing protein [Prevotella sp.]
MKRLLSLSLFLMTAMLSFAHDFESGGIYYNITSSTAPYTVAVTYQGTSYSQYQNEYEGVVNITESVEYNGTTYSVTSIDEYAFRDCSTMFSITIPNSVKSIGSWAFESCSSLTAVTIPNSVTSIGDGAFVYCTGLSSMVVEAGNTVYDSRNNCNAIIETATANLLYGCASTIIPSNIKKISASAFEGCNGLKQITIPKSLTKIGSKAFYGCGGLTSIVVEAGNTVYDSRNNCNAIIETATNTLLRGCHTTVIPNGVNRIESRAFSGSKRLTSISIPSSVVSVGSSAFEGTGLYDNHPDGVIYIDGILYSYKGTMPDDTEIDIFDGTRLIADNAFQLCKGLKAVMLPNSMVNIGRYAFAGCEKLSSINLPNSIESIGRDAFNQCRSLTSVTLPNLTYLDACLFYLCTGLTSVTIPNSVTSIGNDAFTGSGLTSVTIPNSVTTIGDYAFYRCTNLTSVTIPNSVTSIGNGAFAYCNGLTEVVSNIKEPISVSYTVWYNVNTEEIPLYVPIGTKTLYQKTGYWNLFKNIIERGLSPVGQDETINYAENPDINSGTDLNGTVIDDIYYHIPNVDGGYQDADGSITILTPSADSQVEKIVGKDVFDASVAGNITGIILMMPAGNGSITIKGETLGAMTLKVKVGDSAVATVQQNGKQEITIPYNVSTASYVYIYAGQAANQARRASKVSSAGDALKIYGIALNKSTTGIEAIDNGKLTNDNAVSRLQNGIYTLIGVKVSDDAADLKTLKQGIYIVNGRKVAVK